MTTGTHKVQALSNAVCGGSCLRRLDLARINLSDNSPSAAVGETEYKDENNREPSAHAIGVHRPGSI